jgi:hypothetical protein
VILTIFILKIIFKYFYKKIIILIVFFLKISSYNRYIINSYGLHLLILSASDILQYFSHHSELKKPSLPLSGDIRDPFKNRKNNSPPRFTPFPVSPSQYALVLWWSQCTPIQHQKFYSYFRWISTPTSFLRNIPGTIGELYCIRKGVPMVWIPFFCNVSRSSFVSS